EDGIRDLIVTGVQTCALPISQAKPRSLLARLLGRELEAGSYSSGEGSIPLKEVAKFPFAVLAIDVAVTPKDKIPRMVVSDGEKEIGRASCRERVEGPGVGARV